MNSRSMPSTELGQALVAPKVTQTLNGAKLGDKLLIVSFYDCIIGYDSVTQGFHAA
jgi:hypothetical protein